MGQPVSVIEKPTSLPGVVRFETNRVLSGMGHERYLSGQIDGNRPTDVLARRIFERGGIKSVHVNGGIVTVEMIGKSSTGIREIIESLYTFYRAES